MEPGRYADVIFNVILVGIGLYRPLQAYGAYKIKTYKTFGV